MIFGGSPERGNRNAKLGGSGLDGEQVDGHVEITTATKAATKHPALNDAKT